MEESNCDNYQFSNQEIFPLIYKELSEEILVELNCLEKYNYNNEAEEKMLLDFYTGEKEEILSDETEASDSKKSVYLSDNGEKRQIKYPSIEQSEPLKRKKFKTETLNTSEDDKKSIMTNYSSESKGQKMKQVIFQTLTSEPHSKKKYQIVTSNIKEQCLEDLKNMRMTEVAKKYNVSKRSLTRWKANGIERKKGSGRKLKDQSLAKKILEWYHSKDSKTVTSKCFREVAKIFSNDPSFFASTGWLTKFKKKYNITLAKY